MADQSKETTDFGFRTVAKEEKKRDGGRGLSLCRCQI